MSYKIVFSGELFHHGVQGQHWGVQNGPPYPLDRGISTGSRLKNSESKKLVRKLAKAKSNEESVDIAARYALRPSNHDAINEIYELKNKYLECVKDGKNLIDYYDSDKYREDTADAYDATKKWFEENDKAYLDKIIELDGGEDHGFLDKYHDFRKVYDGYLDDYWTLGILEYYELHPEIEAHYQKVQEAFDAYYNKLVTYSKELLGKNANRSVYIKDDKLPGKRAASAVVKSAIERAIQDEDHMQKYFGFR